MNESLTGDVGEADDVGEVDGDGGERLGRDGVAQQQLLRHRSVNAIFRKRVSATNRFVIPLWEKCTL